ncbi:MAG: hypothetical protein HN919_22790, partial [Verrucomicrobia bacterium]|nr:hypothetical protein [Verrucomicrobiota bacterium]
MLRSIESSFGFLAIQLRRRLPIFASTAACSLLILTSVALGRPQTEALVEDISGTSYLPTVQAELQAATSSIVVAMFEMRVPQDAAAENPSLVLVNELIAAHARGVDVDVILNLRSRFDPESTDPVRDHANGLAAGMLTYKGVDVSYFPQTYHMHSKLVVIDGKTVVVGSHNWTYSALAKNIESSSLIRSPEHAQEKLANIAKLKTVSAAVKLPPDVEQIISVPLGFLLSPDLAPFMTTQNDERAFDAYLLLHRYSDEKEGDAVLSVDMQRLASDLAIDSSKGGSYSRKIATRPLRKLADHYRLIDLEIPRGKNAQVTFLNNALGSAAGVIHLPLAYWTYDLATELKQAEKMAYLICLNEETQALTPPLWMKNQSDLTKKYS